MKDNDIMIIKRPNKNERTEIYNLCKIFNLTYFVEVITNKRTKKTGKDIYIFRPGEWLWGL